MFPKNASYVACIPDEIEVAASCERGVCSTRLTRVLDGRPDHWDMCLTSEEQAANDPFLPCSSRARSARLVLDP